MVTEEINEDDLYFICYMTERVAQAIHQPCSYVVNSIGKKKQTSEDKTRSRYY